MRQRNLPRGSLDAPADVGCSSSRFQSPTFATRAQPSARSTTPLRGPWRPLFQSPGPRSASWDQPTADGGSARRGGGAHSSHDTSRAQKKQPPPPKVVNQFCLTPDPPHDATARGRPVPALAAYWTPATRGTTVVASTSCEQLVCVSLSLPLPLPLLVPLPLSASLHPHAFSALCCVRIRSY